MCNKRNNGPGHERRDESERLPAKQMHRVYQKLTSTDACYIDVYVGIMYIYIYIIERERREKERERERESERECVYSMWARLKSSVMTRSCWRSVFHA